MPTLKRRYVLSRLSRMEDGALQVEIVPADQDTPVVSQQVRELLLEQTETPVERELIEERIKQVNTPTRAG